MLEKMDIEEEENWYRALIIFLNLIVVNIEFGNYDAAWDYANRSERFANAHKDKGGYLSYVLTRAILFYKTGMEEEARKLVPELLARAKTMDNPSDYKQEMGSFCELLCWLEEYDGWKNMIEQVDIYAEKLGTADMKFFANELWVRYYEYTGDKEKYTEACVKHTRLYFEEMKEVMASKCRAVDIRITLGEKEAERRRAELLSTIDPLTGLGNRKKLSGDIGRLLREAVKSKTGIGVGILDIDYFKKANDTYGHICGDRYLEVVAEIIKNAPGDGVNGYRFGGDEFVIILSNATGAKVSELAEYIKAELENRKLENENSKISDVLTLSQGYICMEVRTEDNLESLLDMADKVLYKVKSRGRNDYLVE